MVTVPAVDPKRYYSVQLIDWNTFNFGYIGSRATGHEAGSYLIAGPDWTGETPPGIRQVFRSSTQFAMALFRTQLFDAADMAKVEKVQAGYKVQPLSAFRGQSAPPAAPAIAFPKIDKNLAKANFFEYLPRVEGTRQIYDLAVCVGRNIMRTLSGINWRATEVRLPYRRPADIEPYRRHFQVPLQFDAERAAVVFPAEVLRCPVQGADPTV